MHAAALPSISSDASVYETLSERSLQPPPPAVLLCSYHDVCDTAVYVEGRMHIVC